MRRVAMLGSALVLAGCGGQVSGEPMSSVADPSATALAGIDMCTILTEDELLSFGQRPDTREVEDGLGDLGCGWLGTPITLSLTRNLEDRSDDAFDREVNFISLRENDIAGRNGVQGRVDEGSCDQQLDAGSGSILVIIRADQGGNVDPCAEAVAVAELIEPRLPEVGS